MNKAGLTVVLFAVILSACGGPTPSASTPGIGGTWTAPIEPNGSFTLQLQPAANCATNGPCAVTGTFKDGRNGGSGAITSAQIDGNAVHVQATIGAENAKSDLTCDTTLDSSQVKMTGTCTVKGQNSNAQQTFPVSFGKQ